MSPKDAKYGSNKCLQVFIAVVVAFKDTVYILYNEIHLKTAKPQILRENARVARLTQEPG